MTPLRRTRRDLIVTRYDEAVERLRHTVLSGPGALDSALGAGLSRLERGMSALKASRGS